MIEFNINHFHPYIKFVINYDTQKEDVIMKTFIYHQTENEYKEVDSIPDITFTYEDKDKFPNGKWCDVGDYVCYGRHVGQKLYYKGIRLLLLFDDQVMMKVDDPTNLDMTYNLAN